MYKKTIPLILIFSLILSSTNSNASCTEKYPSNPAETASYREGIYSCLTGAAFLGGSAVGTYGLIELCLIGLNDSSKSSASAIEGLFVGIGILATTIAGGSFLRESCGSFSKANTENEIWNKKVAPFRTVTNIQKAFGETHRDFRELVEIGLLEKGLDIRDVYYNLMIYGENQEELCPGGEYTSLLGMRDWIQTKNPMTAADFSKLGASKEATRQHGLYDALQPHSEALSQSIRKYHEVSNAQPPIERAIAEALEAKERSYIEFQNQFKNLYPQRLVPAPRSLRIDIPSEIGLELYAPEEEKEEEQKVRFHEEPSQV